MAPPKPARDLKKYFSVDEANKALPLVKMIVGDIVRQWDHVNSLKQRLAVVARRDPRRRAATADPYLEEVVQSQAEMETEEAKLRSYMEELEHLGVELKGFDGLCDFPSLRDGREIYLCWRLGEPDVAHWHDLNAGFAGRQPLHPAPAATSSGKGGR